MAAAVASVEVSEGVSITNDSNEQMDAPNLVDEVLQAVEKEVDVKTVKEESPGRDSSPASLDEAIPPSSGSTPKESAKSKRKEDKSIEHILKALNSLQSPEEKLAALCKKYADLLEEHRLLQTTSKQSQKKLTMLMREKDQLQTEHGKTVLAKSKLESLCRELQRHNKLVKEESLARAREEEEKRKEVTNKFQTTITEIQQQMTENSTTNMKLREEKTELVSKIKTLMEKYELREQHFDKVLKHKEIEQQLADAKLAQSELKGCEEKELHEKEKQILMLEAAEARKKVLILEEQEKQLRSQVALYTDKYEEFQDTLKKSNDVFSSFKSEMDKMTKKIKKLEKETNMWRSRWENSNKALLDMAEEKTRSDKEMALLNSKIKKLESLCRALQQQRGLGIKTDQGNTNTAVAAEADSSSGKTNGDASCSPAAAAASSSSTPSVSSPAVSSSTVEEPRNVDTSTPEDLSDAAAPVSNSDDNQGAASVSTPDESQGETPVSSSELKGEDATQTDVAESPEEFEIRITEVSEPQIEEESQDNCSA